MAMNNMYRVGDYVYVDTGPTDPYSVRRIDELQKLPNGNVEVEVMMYYRQNKWIKKWIMFFLSMR